MEDLAPEYAAALVDDPMTAKVYVRAMAHHVAALHALIRIPPNSILEGEKTLGEALAANPIRDVVAQCLSDGWQTATGTNALMIVADGIRVLHTALLTTQQRFIRGPDYKRIAEIR